MVAVRVESPLIRTGRLNIGFRFPYVNSNWAGPAGDWQNPDRHTTQIVSRNATCVDLIRKLDATVYGCAITFPIGMALEQEAKDEHRLSVAEDASSLEFSVIFAEAKVPAGLPDFAKARAATGLGPLPWQPSWVANREARLEAQLRRGPFRDRRHE